MQVRCAVANGSHRALLEASPDIPGDFVLSQHKISNYIKAVDALVFEDLISV
jgi:hypothetical protein